MAEWVTGAYPAHNVLVNNAGIQRGLRFNAPEPWDRTQSEIAINFEAPVHLTMLLLLHLQAQPRSAVINVTSGLALSPLAGVPVYSATKAAMHSFSQSLRRQLGQTTVGQTPVAVIEVLPPAVDTDLGGPGQHTCGVPLDQFADEAMGRLASGELEIVFRT